MLFRRFGKHVPGKLEFILITLVIRPATVKKAIWQKFNVMGYWPSSFHFSNISYVPLICNIQLVLDETIPVSSIQFEYTFLSICAHNLILYVINLILTPRIVPKYMLIAAASF